MLHFDLAQEVAIQVAEDGSVWVNVDGRCALRVVCAAKVIVDDPVHGSDIVAPRERQALAPLKTLDPESAQEVSDDAREMSALSIPPRPRD